MQYLFMLGRVRRRQCSEIGQYLCAVLEIAAIELADDKRMGYDLLFFEQIAQAGVLRPKMIYPNRGVDQNHLRGLRRLRGMS